MKTEMRATVSLFCPCRLLDAHVIVQLSRSHSDSVRQERAERLDSAVHHQRV